jgi:lycopene beta-cyclase
MARRLVPPRGCTWLPIDIASLPIVNKSWDIVIVGGGLGGLALAAELAAPEFTAISVLVLEKRTHYVRDRTWSYWATTPHRYSHLERHRWNQWTASLGDVVHSQSSKRINYASLDADAFYQEAVKAVSASSHVTLRMSAGVVKMDTIGSAETVISLADGETVHARRVLDARPLNPTAPSDLVQQFVGWEVRVDGNVFDSDKVQLMAFKPNPNGVHFFYVLPYSESSALVESTWISPSSWQPDFDTELRKYLAEVCGSRKYSTSYREAGVLCLQEASPPNERAAALGRRGGTLRASTGYAFLDTLAHSSLLARSLSAALQAGTEAAWQPTPFPRAYSERWMDAVFLAVVARDWRQAPGYFMQLFGSVAVDDTVAFLTGRATFRQRLRVMWALPATPFAHAALLRSFSWLVKRSLR